MPKRDNSAAGAEPSQRQLRVGEELRHALARLFERGTLRDPQLAGVAITVLAPVFTSTHGFQAMWFICAAAALGSLPFLHRLRDADRDRRELREDA